jgi:transposase InsO family protein
VQIKSFRADNAPFNAAEFKNDLENKGQTISFSGVGAHHQNGAAERAIKTTTSWARTMMLHAILHWPEQTTLDLWPFAMDHAVYCWNHLPS